MRLIDADALIDDLMERYCKECNKRKGYSGKFIYEIGEAPCRACEVDDVKAELEEAPTVDVPDRKVGKWKDGHRSSWDGTFHWYRYCDQCDYERDDDDPIHDSYFCPNCGARMVEDD